MCLQRQSEPGSVVDIIVVVHIVLVAVHIGLVMVNGATDVVAFCCFFDVVDVVFVDVLLLLLLLLL